MTTLDICRNYTYDNKGDVLTQQTRNSPGATFIKAETAYTANLKRMVKGAEGTTGYESLDYACNAEGLRIRKVHTVYDTDAEANVVTTTDYTLHGKNVVQVTRTKGLFAANGTPVPNAAVTGDSLHFWYDASGTPSLVEHSATDANSTTTPHNSDRGVYKYFLGYFLVTKIKEETE